MSASGCWPSGRDLPPVRGPYTRNGTPAARGPFRARKSPWPAHLRPVAVEGRPEHVRHAVMADPNAASSLTVERIWELCDDLVRADGDLLPEPLRPG